MNILVALDIMFNIGKFMLHDDLIGRACELKNRVRIRLFRIWDFYTSLGRELAMGSKKYYDP